MTKIELELKNWERNNSDYAIIDDLQSETRSTLLTIRVQIKQLEEGGNPFRHISPTTLDMYKKAVRHELRKRSWRWPLIESSLPVLNWYLLKFRNKYLSNNKRFGFKMEDVTISKTKWWQEDLRETIKPIIIFAKNNWKYIVSTLVVIMLGWLNYSKR